MQSTGWRSRAKRSIWREILPVSLAAALVVAGCAGDEGDAGNSAGTGGSAGGGGKGSSGKAGTAGGGSGNVAGTGNTGGSGLGGDSGGPGNAGESGDAGDAGGTSGAGGAAGDADAGGASGAGGDGGDNGATSEFCPGSRWRPVSFVALETLPQREDLPLPEVPSFAEVVGAGDGFENSVRLDVCEAEDGELSLGAVLHVGSSLGLATLYRADPNVTALEQDVIEIDGGLVEELRLPPSDVVVTRLAKALAGDYEGFSVEFRTQYGALLGGGNGMVAFARGRPGSPVEYSDITFVTGTLAPGDVFAGLPCAFGERPISNTFSLDTASLDVAGCAFQDVGETTGYRLTSLSVEDTNSLLSVQEQARHAFEGKDAIAAVLTYQYNHHNACDSFHLALPHADYAATTEPLAGCGGTVPNAPERDFEDFGPMKFRVRYHGGAWVDAQHADCGHYLFCE